MLVLGLRSWFSLADGFLSPRDSMRAAKDAGASTVAFADRGDLAGYFEFFEAASELGLKVVPGIELAVDYRDERRPALVFGVGRNAEDALWELVAQAIPACDETFNLPCVDINLIDGNLALFSGIADSHVQQLLWAHDEAGLVDFLKTVAENKGKVAIAISPDDLDPQSTQILSRVKAANKALRILPYSPLIYREGEQEQYRQCRALVFGRSADETLETSASIRTVAQLAGDNPLFDRSQFNLLDRYALETTKSRPRQGTYRDLTPEQCQQKLEEICNEQFSRFIAHVEQHERAAFDGPRREVYEARLKNELSAVAKSGFAPSILMAVDCAQALESAGIHHRARGSAVNSLVTFLSSISSINPVYERLPFERFINPARVKEPDIDLDIQASKAAEARDAILDAIPGAVLLRQFIPALFVEGLDPVLRIADPRRPDFVLMELAKALGCRRDHLRSKTLNQLRQEFPKFDETFTSLRPREDFKMKDALRMLELFDGRPRRSDFHVGIGYSLGGPLAHVPMLPVIAPSGRTALMAAVPYKTAIEHGVMKTDAIPCKDIDLAICVNQSINAQDRAPFVPTIPDIQPEHLRTIFHEGRVATLPHYHNNGALLAKAAPRTFEELVDVNGLIRLTGKPDVVDRYVSGSGEGLLREQLADAPPRLIDDILSVTRDTRHVILYDEQLIEAFSIVGGVTKAEADIMRTEIKSGAGLSEQSSGMMLSGLMERYQIEKDVAEKALHVLSSGGGYLFPRGHALSYAAAAANLAVAKRDYPAEYMLGYIRHYRLPSGPITNKAFRQNLGSLCWELSSLGYRVTMGRGDAVTAYSVVGGDLRPGVTHGTAGRSEIVLGLDVLPTVSTDDLEAFQRGEKVSQSTEEIVAALRGNDDNEARKVFYEGLGFLPHNLHPGFCAKRRLPSNLLRKPPKDDEIVPVACFVKKVQPVREANGGWTVSAELTSHMGDSLMYAGRFFSSRTHKEADAKRFYEALNSLSPFESIELHLSYKSRDNGGGWWNIATPTPQPCPPAQLESCSAIVDRASRGVRRHETQVQHELAA
jgi:DNA polymerase III, alpha subunit